MTAIVGVCGAGVTGRAVGRILRSFGVSVAWFDIASGASDRASREFGGVVLGSFGDLDSVDVVVMATPADQRDACATLIVAGRDVVSMSADPDDVLRLLELDRMALANDSRLVVGAALSPGLTGLLAHRLASQLDVVDEIHVAMFGTGGPACARQHHDALGARSTGWHDGEWIERPGGSGRELCWFPDPIGPADCYRAALADPLVLHRAFPAAERISARVAATRRDRLTARLPMLAPPHAQGNRGAVRVEVRGATSDGARVTHVAGAVGRTGDLAGTVAAVFAQGCLETRLPIGVSVAGEASSPATWALRMCADSGAQLHEFTGVARASA
jgi:hypothetical protein